MTAYKIIDNHDDLSNVGVFTHDQIDNHISGTQFLVSSSSINVPSSSKLLLTGSGIIITETDTSVQVSVDQDFFRSLFVFQDIPTPSPDGVNLEFNLSSTPFPSASLMLYVNGLLQAQGPACDYILSGTAVTMLYNVRSGSNMFGSYSKVA